MDLSFSLFASLQREVVVNGVRGGGEVNLPVRLPIRGILSRGFIGPKERREETEKGTKRTLF